MRITTGISPPRDGQTPILSTSIQPSPAAHADLPHQSAGFDSFRKDFLPLLILLLLKTPENEGMLENAWGKRAARGASPAARKTSEQIDVMHTRAGARDAADLGY